MEKILYCTLLFGFFFEWRMEQYLEVAGDRMTRVLEHWRSSSAGEHYRALVAALRELLSKLANSR